MSSYQQRLLRLIVIGLQVVVGGHCFAQRIESDLSGAGWRMWYDEKAAWQNDRLFLPEESKDLSKLPVNPPTGGWTTLDDQHGQGVSVPGTVEEYLGVQKALGVSWWWRPIQIPSFKGNRVVRLHFGATRHRAEVYLDGQLVGYDLVAETPWSVDLTPYVQPGSRHLLAVRITNPGGNGSWLDYQPLQWGNYLLPTSFQFGGIYDRISLVVSQPTYIEDVYVQNTPVPTQANVFVTISNCTAAPTTGKLVVRVVEADSGRSVGKFRAPVQANPGQTIVTIPISIPSAKLWSIETPNLYRFEVGFEMAGKVVDSETRKAGFRWFAPVDVGSDAHFELNGKRIFLRAAISHGWWGGTGPFPTPECAEREIRSAHALGLNALSFHRNPGNRLSFEKADELGLLYVEEPGGYASTRDAFGRALMREKVLRLVKRDRSHPSFAWFTFINEQWPETGADKDTNVFAAQRQDLEDAHALAPDRAIVYTSATAETVGEAKHKMNCRPFDPVTHFSGWWDTHRAIGPVTWMESDYKNPTNHYGFTDNRAEIVDRGEEAAMSSAPPLGTLKHEIETAPRLGWDGAVYLQRYGEIADFLKRKGLDEVFPNVDALTEAMADVSYEHHGRKIEDHRICDNNDAYFINCWTCFINENFSGMVDAYRNLKGHPNRLARYCRPLAVAVKTRNQILHVGESATVDFYLLNEVNLTGKKTIEVNATDAGGRELWRDSFAFEAKGGTVFGQLIKEGVSIPVGDQPGLVRISARLTDNGQLVGDGSDELLAVSWRNSKVPPNGALWEQQGEMAKFFQTQLGTTVPALTPDTGKLDWLAVARPPFAEPVLVPASAFVVEPQGAAGVRVSYKDQAGREIKIAEPSPQILLNVPHGASPNPAVTSVTRFDTFFDGYIEPPVDGVYRLEATAQGGAIDLIVEGKRVGRFPWTSSPQVGTFLWKAGVPVKVRVMVEKKDPKDLSAQLKWSIPGTASIDPQKIFERVKNDGMRLIIADAAQDWVLLLAQATGTQYRGWFKVGTSWNGGQYFVRAHPLFKDLPVNSGMNWPYQAVLGEPRRALLFEGEQLVAGAQQVGGNELGTAVGVIPYGKGEVIFSTLNIVPELNERDGPANVARRLFLNFCH